jgi:hypothetical protein
MHSLEARTAFGFWVLALALSCSLSPHAALAAGTSLRVVPARGVLDAEIGVVPLIVESGQNAELYFVIQGGDAPFEVTWQFGDQTPATSPKDKVESQPNRSDCVDISESHIYSLGDVQRRAFLSARVTVKDAAGTVASASRAVQVEKDFSPLLKRNRVLERGLWSLHRRLVVSNGKVVPSGESHATAALALMLQTFSNAGHNPFDSRSGPDADPYVDDARALLAGLLDRIVPYEASFDCAPKNERQFTVSDRPTMYQLPMALMALASLREPKRTVIIAQKEEPLWLVCQDLVETILAAQQDGGWRYEPRSGVDMSVTQWPAIALFALEHTTFDPDSGGVAMSDELKVKIESARSALIGCLNRHVTSDGGVCYQPGESSTRPALLGSGICCASWVKLPFDDRLVVGYRKSLVDHWDVGEIAAMDSYAMYAIMKGMRNYEVSQNPVEYGRLRDALGRVRNWYDEFADAIVSHLSKPDVDWHYQGNLELPKIIRNSDPRGTVQTCLALLCLERQVYESAPFAVPRTIPEADLPREVIFDHSNSYSGQIQEHLAVFEWDFGDGTPPVRSLDQIQRVRHKFKPGRYQVTLRVGYHRGARLVYASEPLDVVVPERTVALGRLIPPVNDLAGFFYRKARNQAVLVPLDSEVYEQSRGGWESLQVRWFGKEGQALGDPVTIPSRCGYLLQTFGEGAPLPEQMTVATVPAPAAQAVSMETEVDDEGGGVPSDFGGRPFVVVRGLPGSKPYHGVFCLRVDGGTAWHSPVNLRRVDDDHIGLCETTPPTPNCGVEAARLLVFSELPLNQAHLSTRQKVKVVPVNAVFNEKTVANNVKLAFEEMARNPSGQ